MTPVIKFSNQYTKMPDNPSPSILLEVFVVDDDLSSGFVNYDTQILGGGKYSLPRGKKLVLLLQNSDDILWTTIRRFTPCKHVYYKGLRGNEINIIITETNHSLNDYL